MSETCSGTAPFLVPSAPFLRPGGSPLLESLLARLAGSDRIVALTVEAPRADPAALLRDNTEEGFVYQPPTGPQLAGLGRVLHLEARGDGRFAALAAEARALAPRFELLNFGGGEGRPVFFGGLAFAPLPAEAGMWSDFGDASFVLPRWLFRRQGQTANLTLTLRGSELREPRQRRAWLAELAAKVRALAPLRFEAPEGSLGAEIAFPTAEEAGRRVSAILAEIGAGRLEKVVTALPFEAELRGPADPLRFFRRLRLQAARQETTPFLIRRGDSTFFGATPELLVALDGTHLSSEALAGSCRREQSMFDSADSEKNVHEHQIVVKAIHETLAPLCASLDVGLTRVRHLRRVSHLATAFAGRLLEPRHLLEVAEKLHPTPAVGGWPRREALACLAEVEPETRGWYAGPIGYFDCRGDGELRVALRSAVVRGSRARIYAGAGIVAGSEPAAELAEMIAKAGPMLEALGQVRSAEPVHEPFTL